VEAIKGHTNGFGADVAIDAVRHPAVFDQAFDARARTGRTVLVGVPTPDMQLSVPLIEVFGRGGALESSWYGDCLPNQDFPMLVDLHRQGRFRSRLRHRDHRRLVDGAELSRMAADLGRGVKRALNARGARPKRPGPSRGGSALRRCGQEVIV
jgi:threonine dehydrogenase-like Zn-dependent dehydrogenase